MVDVPLLPLSGSISEGCCARRLAVGKGRGSKAVLLYPSVECAQT